MARALIAVFLVVAASAVLGPVAGWAQGPAGQQHFEAPEAAVAALLTALETGDDRVLLGLFGARHADLVITNDPGYRQTRVRLAREAQEYQLLRQEADGRLTLLVGYQAWPFPIPLVKEAAGWRFDSDAGRQELIVRRIGANELATIAVVRGYVDAQRQYAARPRDGSRVRQFARRLRSTPGKRDGLYWEADPAKGEEPSPVGPLLVGADPSRPASSFNGYRFKILTRQGTAAPAGRYDYVINGRLIAGYALVAYPADYGKSGIKTFVVNHYGVVYEKDLGVTTARLAGTMTEYNPDRSWKVVEP